MVKYLTTKDNGHVHTYTPKASKTSFDDGHSHPIKNGRIQVAGRFPHTHKKTKKVAK